MTFATPAAGSFDDLRVRTTSEVVSVRTSKPRFGHREGCRDAVLRGMSDAAGLGRRDHRLLHERAALIRAEEDAWAHAVIGPKWVTRAYRQGVVASVGGGPGATHYVVSLDASGEAQPGPLTPAHLLVPLVAA